MTILAATAVAGGLWSAGTPYIQRVEGIQTAVLLALLEHPKGPRLDPDLVVCVEVWSGREWMAYPGKAEDPSAQVLEALRSYRRGVVPTSDCEGTDEGISYGRPGKAAVLIGVASPRRVNDHFARVEGGWFYHGVHAIGWGYTVSFVDGQWVVDTEKCLWVS